MFNVGVMKQSGSFTTFIKADFQLFPLSEEYFHAFPAELTS
jgi:hypothetical protein